MKKTGIMGGTFDPIHKGHVMMGVAAKEQYGLDDVLFMPTGTPAYKMGQRQITDGEHRAAMVQLAISGYDGMEFSDMELRRAGNTYTSDTLQALRRENPDTEYYYIVGADSIDYMDRWHCPEIIFQNAVILAAGRCTQTEEHFLQTIDFLKNKYGADIRVLDMPQVPVSSSFLRENICQGEDITEWLPDGVLEYIRCKKLYLPVTKAYVDKSSDSPC